MNRWFITMHALGRMKEMGLDRREVVAVLDNAEVDYGRTDVRVAKRGDLAVVYSPRRRSVITVLLNRMEQWDRATNRVAEAA